MFPQPSSSKDLFHTYEVKLFINQDVTILKTYENSVFQHIKKYSKYTPLTNNVVAISSLNYSYLICSEVTQQCTSNINLTKSEQGAFKNANKNQHMQTTALKDYIVS